MKLILKSQTIRLASPMALPSRERRCAGVTELDHRFIQLSLDRGGQKGCFPHRQDVQRPTAIFRLAG